MRRGVAGMVAALTLAVCSGASAADKAWEEAELPMPIFMVRININAESDMLGAVMRAAAEDIGRCCFFANNEFSFRSDAPAGRALTSQDILDAVDSRASLYAIGLENLENTLLVEPLFGDRMRRHTMTKPQEGCIVVSGVRDGVRRAGVINAYKDDPPEVDTALSRCNISALLLLHGLPEDEAMDYQKYSAYDNLFEHANAPDMAKLNARDLELNGPYGEDNVVSESAGEGD